eukprot:69817-Prymnesium_polylepis.1
MVREYRAGEGWDGTYLALPVAEDVPQAAPAVPRRSGSATKSTPAKALAGNSQGWAAETWAEPRAQRRETHTSAIPLGRNPGGAAPTPLRST